MRYREVSALTNSGIADAFKILVQDIQGDNILQKEFHDSEKQKNKEHDELKDEEVSKHITYYITHSHHSLISILLYYYSYFIMIEYG